MVSSTYAGWGFASRAVPHADSFPKSVSEDVPEALRHLVLAFDYWVHNADRRDANTNLLWQASKKRLWVIDHHDTLSKKPVRTVPTDHVFRGDWNNLWHGNTGHDLVKAFRAALMILPQVWEEMPKLWREAHPTMLPEITDLLGRTLG